MNVDEAKEICRDFRPKEQKDGTVKCRNLLSGDTCRLDTHFVCELVKHRDATNNALSKKDMNATIKKRRLAEISVSRVATLQTCPRLYQLRYIYRLQSPMEARWKVVGTAFGDESSKIEQGHEWSLSKYDLSGPERARLSAVLRRYAEFWERRQKETGEELVSETKAQFEYGGVKFVGFIDAETFDGKKLYEKKYAQVEYDQLKIARQAAVYFKGKPAAEDFILVVVKKPSQMKPKKAAKPTKKCPEPKDETLAEFEQRVYEAIDETWFRYTTFKRKDFDIDNILNQMVSAWKQQEDMEARGEYPPVLSPRTCDDCEFRSVCENHLSRDIGCNHEYCATKALCIDIRAARNRLEDPTMKTPKLTSGAT
jgi:CRISPR/Cas system-associated exonuclease Cas4 (RecB family)